MDKQDIDIKSLIETIISEENHDAIRWEIRGNSLDSTVEGDPRLIRTLLRNLIANIRVHGKSGTLARIELTDVGLVFENTAVHIPDSISKNAFRPFVGTPGKGSGIGLSLVKRIADLHGWTVSLNAIDAQTIRIEIRF